MKLSVKLIYVDYGFMFPKFVTALHFVSGAIVAFAIRSRREPTHVASLTMETEKVLIVHRLQEQYGMPTGHEFWCMIFPIALTFALSIVANNMALMYSSAAFTEIVACTSPVVSIGLILCMGMPFNLRLLAPTLLVVAGASLSTAGELNFSGLGMALCFTSILMRSLKVTLQQRVMTGTSKAKFDPVTLLGWMCVPSAVLLMTWSAFVEGLSPFIMLKRSTSISGISLALMLSCVNACILNLSNLFCVKDLGAVGVQLVAQTKAVLTVLGGVALLNETVTALEVVGFAGILIGVFVFSKMEEKQDK
jgi:drug/metabolite transporter (DMT)-like permease